MRHDETRDNTTNLEATLIAADAHAETREDATTWSECECEDCTGDVDDHDVAESDHWDGYDPAAEMYADHIAAFYGGE